MEKKKRWLFLSILVAALGLVPLAVASGLTKGMTNDIPEECIKFAARVIGGVLLILYIKKVYKIRIGIRKENLIKGVFWYGLTIVLFVALILVLSRSDYGTPDRSLVEILPLMAFYAVTNLGIGLLEESVCRCVLFNSFKAFFGDNKKGVYLAAFVSSLLFGAIHLGNLNGSNTISTITQVIYATFAGMLFAVIYYRSGNLLSCIILHGLVDFADCFWKLFFKNRGELKMIESTTDSSIGDAVVTIALTSVFLIAALVQLHMEFRNTKKRGKVSLQEA